MTSSSTPDQGHSSSERGLFAEDPLVDVSPADLVLDAALQDELLDAVADTSLESVHRRHAAGLLAEAFGEPLAHSGPQRVGSMLRSALESDDVWLLGLVADHLFADLEVAGLEVTSELRSLGRRLAESRAGVDVFDLVRPRLESLAGQVPGEVSAVWLRLMGWVSPELLVETWPQLDEVSKERFSDRAVLFGLAGRNGSSEDPCD